MKLQEAAASLASSWSQAGPVEAEGKAGMSRVDHEQLGSDPGPIGTGCPALAGATRTEETSLVA